MIRSTIDLQRNPVSLGTARSPRLILASLTTPRKLRWDGNLRTPVLDHAMPGIRSTRHVLSRFESAARSSQTSVPTRVLAAALAVALLAAACGGDDDGGLRNANDVRAEATNATATAQSSAKRLAPGESAQIGDLKVTVTGAKPAQPMELGRPRQAPNAGDQWMTVHVKLENATSKELSPIGFALPCGGSQYMYNEPGALQNNKSLPAKSVDEGDILIATPANCRPLLFTVTPSITIGGKPEPVTWALP